MNNGKILKGQSLFDIAIQETGTIESIFDIAVDNNISITDVLDLNRALLVDAENPNKKIISYFHSLELFPASDYEKRVSGGIGSMGIEIDFIVS